MIGETYLKISSFYFEKTILVFEGLKHISDCIEWTSVDFSENYRTIFVIYVSIKLKHFVLVTAFYAFKTLNKITQN